MMRAPVAALVAMLTVSASGRALANDQFGLIPEAVYREYQQHLYWPKEWRVTDPLVKRDRAIRDYLPNPIMPLEIDTLDGATRAEFALDRWGGHPGTSGKAIHFNNRDWIPVPEFETAPANKDPRCYLYEDNPVTAVPLAHLKKGHNTFQGTASSQVCMSFDWGQWGFYGLVLRVFHRPNTPHPKAAIVSPVSGAGFADNPIIKIDARAVARGATVDRIEVFAHYDGFDVDGDGVGAEWHGRYEHTEVRHHVGTLTAPPWELGWDTSWIPDQKAGAVKLIARVRDTGGVWYVTKVVDGLTLSRSDRSVQIARTNVADIPYRFNVRAGQRKRLVMSVPAALGLVIKDARFEILTWNGGNGEHSHHEVKINDWAMGHVQGQQFAFFYSRVPVPASAMKVGENVVEFYSDNEHHGPELLWPGPALLVRLGRPSGGQDAK